jgi:hypothetical protein
VAIYELYPEVFGIGEGGFDGEVDGWRMSGCINRLFL